MIDDEIGRNIAWANAHGISIRPDELVAGEHSGTKILPQQPDDNPNFVASLTAHGIGWLGMDASREPEQRGVGSALGVPRHPINVFYNVGTPEEEVSEYNWIYTSVADGGSGICTAHPETTTCISPLDPATGFASHIVPEQVQIMLGYVLTNDPRPFYLHQSNLAESRLAYPVLSAVLSAYRSMYAASAPVVDQTMTADGQVLQNQSSWQQTRTAGTVSGHVQGGVVTVSGPPGTTVPVTVPAGTTVGSPSGAAFGAAYAGERSAYVTMGPSSTLTLSLPPGAIPPVPAAPPVPSIVAPPESTLRELAVPPIAPSDAVRIVTDTAATAAAPKVLPVPTPSQPAG